MSISEEAMKDFEESVDRLMNKIDSFPKSIDKPLLPEHSNYVEAYLILIKDLNIVLGEDWANRALPEIKSKISSAIANSLRIWI